MRRVLYTILAVALAAPVVFITIMLGSEYTLFVIVLDLVVAAIAGTLAYFWWRCPACRRPFAGRLVGREQRTTADTAQVRDVYGFSHSATVRRATVVSTYRCRHCGNTFRR